jgi:hypothetical protein
MKFYKFDDITQDEEFLKGRYHARRGISERKTSYWKGSPVNGG